MLNLNNRLKKLEGEFGKDTDSDVKEQYVNALIKWFTSNDKSDFTKLKEPKDPSYLIFSFYIEAKERMKKHGLSYHPDFLAEIRKGIRESAYDSDKEVNHAG